MGLGIELHNDVHVAIWPRFVAGHGAEDREGLHPEPLPEFVPVCPQDLQDLVFIQDLTPTRFAPADDRGTFLLIEVAMNGVADALSKFLQSVGLGEDGVSLSSCFVAALG